MILDFLMIAFVLLGLLLGLLPGLLLSS